MFCRHTAAKRKLWRSTPMNLVLQKNMEKVSRSKSFTIILYVLIVLFMGSLNAFVDKFLHPEIPFFDSEHLLVGGVTAMVTIVLYGALISHMYHLRRAINTISSISSILPICANCKKIRKPQEDPRTMKSWQSIEIYLSEKTKQSLSHGICPECLQKLYPEYSDQIINNDDEKKDSGTSGKAE